MRTDKEIGEQIAKTSGETVLRLGLRFDRVVVRVLGDLKSFAKARVPKGQTVVLTLTAPILTPAKTVAALEIEIDALLQAAARDPDRTAVVCGNGVRLRLVKHAPSRSYEIIGLVHNRDISSKRLADLAEQWLRGTT